MRSRVADVVSLAAPWEPSYVPIMREARVPGEELIERGLADLAAGVVTVESLLVSVAAPRLRALGYVVTAPIADAELALYALLSAQHGAAAHGRYNALVRRLVSFQRAASCAR